MQNLFESNFESRFELTLAAACRARMLAQGHTPKVTVKGKIKPTVIALEEIAQGKVGREMLKRVK